MDKIKGLKKGRINVNINRVLFISTIILFLFLFAYLLDVNALIISGREGNYYNGTIDEVRIWNITLSGEEVKQHYSSNLRKYGLDKWEFYTNQSDLSVGTYTYQGFAKDKAGNENMTEMRVIIIEEGMQVTSCRVLDQANTVYTMITNIIDNSLTGPCLNITAQNITLDCSGFYIKSDDAVSGVYSNQRNTTVKNCNVSMSSSTGGYGIYLYGADYSYIYNNTLNDQYYGLYLNDTSFTWIEKNTLISTYEDAIYLISSSNNTMVNNTANSCGYVGSQCSGIKIQLGSNNTIINNTANSNRNLGIFLSSSSDNRLIANTLNSNGYGIDISGSNNILTDNKIISSTFRGIEISSKSNTLIDNTISDSGSTFDPSLSILGSNNTISGGVISTSDSNLVEITGSNNRFVDVQLINAAKNDTYLRLGINNTFLNCSYNISKEYVASGSQLIRKWYYRAKVNDTNKKDVSNASVSLYDKNNQLINRVVTNSIVGLAGWTNKTEIIDYINLGGVRDYYSPYTITAVNKSSVGYHRNYNITKVTNNLNDVITIDVEYPRIKFESPKSDYITDAYWVFVNVSANDTYSNISTFIDFDNSLVGWWRFDDVNTIKLGAKVYDNSSYGNNGTAYGNAAQTDSGYFGRGFSFDGNGDYVDITDNDFYFNQNLTISMWINPSNLNSQKSLITSGSSGGDPYWHTVLDGSIVRIYFGTGYNSITPGIQANIWQHIVFVVGSGTTNAGTLYFNGVSKGNFNRDDGTGAGVYIGYHRSGYSYSGWFNGTIDEVMVFNRSLSAEEIKALYANQTSRYLTHNFTGLSDKTHTFKAYAQDTAGNVNNTKRTVNTQNLPPTIPILISPPNGANNLIDRYVKFDWTDSVDGRNDPITYQINLSNFYRYKLQIGIVDSNYTWQEPLMLDLVYNWSVRACDYELCSNWSASWNFSIIPYVSISLTVNETIFGTLIHKEIKNTTLWNKIGDAPPSPFIVENIGNVETDIRVNASRSLWTSVGLATSYFQFMAGNTTEKSSFNWIGSQKIWENMSATPKLVIDNLGYNITNNSAEIEFRIEVPQNEPTGDKRTNITVIGVIG